ncbi:MAG TPA: hypothetical protein VK585_17925 [Jiangellaceae bacterium]|nr:hypothetical protein [Jiangellaceae bacterium]
MTGEEAAVYGATGDYSFGYVLLAVTAGAALTYTATTVRRRARRTMVEGLECT